MIDMGKLQEALSYVARCLPDARPVCGLLLGSGWGEVAAAFEIRAALEYDQIPGLGATGVPGHAGRLLWAELAGLETLVFQGRRHWYEGAGWDPVAAPVFLLKKLGAEIVVLTNAAGGLRSDLAPGDLLVIDDHINGMGANPLIGPHDPFWGPRFPAMACVYDAGLRATLDAAGREAGQKLAHGLYLAVTGPVFETPAEIAAFRRLGADAVGMSTVPEALLAHAAGLRVVGLSCISNLGAGAPGGVLSHAEVLATLEACQPRMRVLLQVFWEQMRARRAEGRSACASAATET